MGEMDLTYLDSAYAYYQQALNLDRSNVNVLINVANLTYGMGRISEADSMFATVLENEPNNIDALIRRGEIADQQGRYDDAVSYYNRALEQKADLCDVWFNLGVIYFQRLRKMEDAEQAFTRSADLCPDDINAHVNLSVVLITNNRLDEAVSRLSKFTAEHPEECVGWDLYSQALIRNGQKEEALAANKKYEECSQKP
jgi:tetratricopeptide (TPR) repeat protein